MTGAETIVAGRAKNFVTLLTARQGKPSIHDRIAGTRVVRLASATEAPRLIIRPEAEFDYLEEPDIFHDIFGHVPMLGVPVFAEFMGLVRGEGTAALVATHNERIAAKMDRIVRLHEGRLEPAK